MKLKKSDEGPPYAWPGQIGRLQQLRKNDSYDLLISVKWKCLIFLVDEKVSIFLLLSLSFTFTCFLNFTCIEERDNRVSSWLHFYSTRVCLKDHQVGPIFPSTSWSHFQGSPSWSYFSTNFLLFGKICIARPTFSYSIEIV